MTSSSTSTAATATVAAADVIDALEAALATTGTLVAGIAPTRWSAPTPCPGWNVRDLTNHLVGGLRLFTAQLTGTDAGRAHEDDWLRDSPAAPYTAPAGAARAAGHSPAAAYTAAAGAALAAWPSPGVMPLPLSISLGDVPAPLGAVIELTEV